MFQISTGLLSRACKLTLTSFAALQLVACNPMDVTKLDAADSANNSSLQGNGFQADRERQKIVNISAGVAIATANAELIAGLTKNIILRMQKKAPEKQRTLSCTYGGSIVVNLETFGAKFDGCKLKEIATITGELVHDPTNPSFQPYFSKKDQSDYLRIEAYSSRRANGSIQVSLSEGISPCDFAVYMSSDALGGYDMIENSGELDVYQWIRGSLCGKDVDSYSTDDNSYIQTTL